MSEAPFLFLRPNALYALLALPLLAWWSLRGSRASSAWQRAVDAHLLPHLLAAGAGRASRLPALLLTLAAALAIVALAGPSLRKLPAPLWQVEAPLVIAFDLSPAMRAGDLPPSRAAQARRKLGTLLRERHGGQVGLIAYAGDAFTVAPITRDAKSLLALLDSLSPDVMPIDGQDAARAVARAQDLMVGAGYASGDILLVTDHADAKAQAAAAAARAAGYRVHALGVGTEAGAPLSTASGFVTGAGGQVQFARLDQASLDAFARAGGGRAVRLARDDGDLAALALLEPRTPQTDSALAAVAGTQAATAAQRSDDGYWLLLPLLLVGALGFRRGWLAALPLALGAATLAAPMHARAADPPAATIAAPAADSFWDRLWQRPDQRARAALEQGDFARARALSEADPDLRASAAYRAGDYAEAAQSWSEGASADTAYNRGNALAQAGRYRDALSAYDEALARAPGMEDAIENRRLVEERLKQQQQEQSKSQDGKPSQDDDRQGSPDAGKDGESRSTDQPPDQQPGQQQGQDGSADPESGEESKPEGSSGDSPGEQGDGEPGDAQQKAANEAAKREMDRALAQAQDQDQPQGEPRSPTQEEARARAQAEQQQAVQQWLRRVPDDPGGLLRRKFEFEHRRRQAQGDKQ